MAVALTDKATLLKTSSGMQDAIETYKRALVYNSRYPDAYYNLGVSPRPNPHPPSSSRRPIRSLPVLRGTLRCRCLATAAAASPRGRALGPQRTAGRRSRTR